VALASAAHAADTGVELTRDVEYADRGDLKLTADIYRPAGEGPFPAVLLVHGGAWTTGDKSHMVQAGQALADVGYVGVSIRYRLAPKYLFPAQIEDCQAAVRWMRTAGEEYGIDPARVGGYGYSAGGHLVALLAAADADDGLESPDAPADAPSTRLQAAVAGGAPCDFRSIPETAELFSFWLGGTRKDQPEAYRLASPIEFVTADDPPLCFFHGGNDRLVPIADAEAMSAALVEAGVESEVKVFSGLGHVGAFLSPAGPEAAIEFFDEHLKTVGSRQ
jgi:acetyl esterase/lipase